jgi:hypothetical protein
MVTPDEKTGTPAAHNEDLFVVNLGATPYRGGRP